MLQATLTLAPALLWAEPSPTPSIKPEDMTPATITPGLPGFFVFFFLSLALLFLLIDMSKRIRKSTARENVRLRMEQRAAELYGAGAGAAGDTGAASGAPGAEPDASEDPAAPAAPTPGDDGDGDSDQSGNSSERS